MRYLGVTLLLAIVVLVGMAWAPLGPARGQAAGPRWEYKVILDNGFTYDEHSPLGISNFYDNVAQEKKLNQLGAEGWELIDVKIYNPEDNSRQYIFKRPAQ